MRLTKPQQIRLLKKQFGSKSDLFDFESKVDGSLSYAENKRIILNKAKRKGLSVKSTLRFKGSPLFLREKANIIHNNRGARSKGQDSRFNSRRTFKEHLLTIEQFNLWRRHPNRYDILTIDSKRSKLSNKIQARKLTLSEIEQISII